MEKYKKYLWLIPALYVAYMFGNKVVEGLQVSEEFQQIISVIPILAPLAKVLTPLVGIWDLVVGLLLVLNPFTLKNQRLQKGLFAWAMIWPFVPASLRYFGGVAEFEIVEVLSIVISAALAYYLYKKYWLTNYTK
jgi:hypothetical protein